MSSKNFERFKVYYKDGEWSKERIYNTVGLKYGITSEEYEEITGESYMPDVPHKLSY